MSLASFGRKIRAAVSQLSAARAIRLSESDVELVVEPPPLPSAPSGTCPTCGQPFPAPSEESVVDPLGEEPAVAP